MKIPFAPADILLPGEVSGKWPVVACDQFTSQPEYWAEAEAIVGGEASTLNIILPEVYLGGDVAPRIAKINATMQEYLASDMLCEYKDAMIYVERSLPDGSVRRGLVGAVDLEAYDYSPTTTLPVRATEGTVLSRIPPRVEIRKDAPAEAPHVMLLADDPEKSVIEPLGEMKNRFDKLYDVELMLGGGHIAGYLLDDEAKSFVLAAMERLAAQRSDGFLFAVGDGNHSLATAKTCYQKWPNELNRYALCELVNLHDDSLVFEPIYRVVFGVDTNDILAAANKYLSEKFKGDIKCTIQCIAGDREENIEVNMPKGMLPVGCLQDFLDEYVKKNPSAEVDYIHGEDVTKMLAQRANTVGFIFRGMKKGDLFDSVSLCGALPRKTFSMGEAASKRYYMECRKIK
ncbi:MAG: DUF1015 domain-containing protein [Clostridia bacterium]|nr:DUF1015 domain-containing protein [Clostridia bacterium]